MPQSLKVLIVEENHADAELLVQELRRAGFEPDWQRVDTEAAYLARLQAGLNLVLSNYQLPQFSGLRALELLKAGGLDVPFIVVSGASGEEPAVTAMKQGASDYLIKNQLARLGQSVSQALETGRSRAERRRVEQQLLLQGTALETAANAIVITDAQGIIQWVNPAFTGQSGYTIGEITGQTPRLLKSGRHERGFYENLWAAIRAGRTWRGCFTNRRKDGTFYFDESTITPVRSKEGTVTHFVAIMNDVTERRVVEDELRAAHAQLRDLLDHNPAVLYAMKVEGQRVTPRFANANVARLLGFEARDAQSVEWWQGGLHPDDRDRAIASIPETLARGVSRHEYRMRHKDGSYRWLEDHRRLVRAESDQPAELAGVWTDITDRKHSEMERERFFTLSLDLLCIVGADGCFLRLNLACEKTLGFTEAEMRGQELLAFVHPDDQAATRAEVGRLKTGATTLNFENRYRRKDGSYCWLSWTAALFPEDGTIYGVGRDTTQRKLAETTLRSSEERFRQVVESIREVFWMLDVQQNRILYVSPSYNEIWGQTPARLYGSLDHFAETIHPEDRERVLKKVRQNPIADHYDETFRIIRPDGTMRWIQGKAFPVRNPTGQIYRVAGVAEDITEQKEAGLRLKLQLAVTSVLAEVASLAEINRKVLETLCREMQWDLGELWMVDRAAKVLRCAEIWHPWSPEFEEFATARRPLTFCLGQDLPGGIWASGRTAWTRGRAPEAQLPWRAQAAGLERHGWIGIPIRIRSEILGVAGFFSLQIQPPDTATLAMLDVLGVQIGIFIERRQMAEQFRQAQKMEAIGTLAGGIAHDFNNVLMAIGGYTELAKMELTGNSRASENLDAVLQGAKRASDLVRQILTFSRQQELERKPIELEPVVAEALKLLRATIPSNIEFEVTLGADVPTVLADATQIHQVVMNLCSNAAHAMKDRPGRLIIKLENFDLDAGLASMLPGLRHGPCVRLSVSDTGRGIDQATLSRIFEPFFTTKALGEGTGLGLAVVHGIMQSHEGAVTVYSHLGEGTTFHLYFPPYAGGKSPGAAPAKLTPRGRGERILYVDDEPLLATMGKKVLERLGYAVEAHTSPTEALAAVRAQPQNYDLVITDQMMPGLMGTDLAEQLRAIRADLPIILTTGFSASLTNERVQAMGIGQLLLKPMSIETLGSAVHEELAKVERAASNPSV